MIKVIINELDGTIGAPEDIRAWLEEVRGLLGGDCLRDTVVAVAERADEAAAIEALLDEACVAVRFVRGNFRRLGRMYTAHWVTSRNRCRLLLFVPAAESAK